MSAKYDRLYESTPDALGAPTGRIVEFFTGLAGNGLRVLDVGCGQGRDALFLARTGHSVVGVDLSPNGIRDLENAARKESLPIAGVVADIRDFTPDGDFDVLLFDRTLHMLDANDRLEALERLIGHVKSGGWVVISDERSNLPGLKGVLDSAAANWQTEHEASGYLFARRV